MTYLASNRRFNEGTYFLLSNSGVSEALSTLNTKEREIVEQRLLADEPRTLQDIGASFKISRERVRQIETRVIDKLRKSFAA